MFLLIWFLFGVVTAVIASNKGDSGCGWFLIGVILGPFGLLLAIFATGKQCPHCRSRIHKGASRCPKCQQPLGGTTFEAKDEPQSLADEGW